jgi:hypothetical protein
MLAGSFKNPRISIPGHEIKHQKKGAGVTCPDRQTRLSMDDLQSSDNRAYDGSGTLKEGPKKSTRLLVRATGSGR